MLAGGASVVENAHGGVIPRATYVKRADAVCLDVARKAVALQSEARRRVGAATSEAQALRIFAEIYRRQLTLVQSMRRRLVAIGTPRGAGATARTLVEGIRTGEIAAGSSVSRSRTSSTPMYSPMPWTAPTRVAGRRALEARLEVGARRPRVLLDPSSSIARRTARPAAQATGEPPTDEKNEPWAPNASAIVRVVITAPTAMPLPAALATVTMSGSTPCCSNAQRYAPSRP